MINSVYDGVIMDNKYGEDAALVDAFFEELKKTRRLSANTEAAYRADLRKLYAIALSERLSNAVRMDVSFFTHLKNALEIRTMSASSLDRFCSCVHSYFSYLASERLIPFNYAEDFSPVRNAVLSEEKEQALFLTIPELSRLLSAPDLSDWTGIRDSAMLELLYAAGLKAGEIIRLKREDVDLQIDFVTVGGREIPFGSRARTALIRYLKASGDLFGSSDGFLFTAKNKKPLSRQQVWKIIRKYAEQAGLDSRVSPQCIRASFARHVLENGMNEESLKQILGLKSDGMLRHYRGDTLNELRKQYRKGMRLDAEERNMI